MTKSSSSVAELVPREATFALSADGTSGTGGRRLRFLARAFFRQLQIALTRSGRGRPRTLAARVVMRREAAEHR